MHRIEFSSIRILARLLVAAALFEAGCGPRTLSAPRSHTPAAEAVQQELVLAEALGPREAEAVVQHLSQNVVEAQSLLQEVEKGLGASDGSSGASSEAGAGQPSRAAADPEQVRALIERLDSAIALIDQMETELIHKGDELPPHLHDQRERLRSIRDALRFPVRELQLAQKCSYGEKCQGNNPGWARYLLGADLAEEQLERYIREIPYEARMATAPVIGVVDSGFDWEGSRYSVQALSLQALPGHAESGDGKIDTNGHGTAVMGMISGAFTGVTNFSHVRSYRVTPAGDAGSVKSSMLADTILRACQESEIVNVSWGSLSDELGYADFSKEAWYVEAVKNGCIVVKAAGNDGFKKHSGTDTFRSVTQPGSPVFLSGALNEFGKEASFSSKAVYLTPGQNVYTLMSRQVERDKYEEGGLCKVEEHLLGPISGTSFSSPYLAGAIGQVVAMLRLRGNIPESPGDKLALVRKILDSASLWSSWAGRKTGTVNVLAAVKIAAAYSGQAVADLSAEQLFAAARDEYLPRCSEQLPSCEQKKYCYSKRKCVNEVREKDFLCRSGNQESRAYLLTLLRQLEEPQLTASLIGTGLQAESKPIMDDLTKSWDKNIYEFSRQYPPLAVTDFEQATNILESAVVAGLGRQFITADRVFMVLNSSGFSPSVDDLRALVANDLSRGSTLLLSRFLDTLAYAEPEGLSKRLDPFGVEASRPKPERELEARFQLIHLLQLRRSILPEPLRIKLDDVRSRTARAIWAGKELPVMEVRSLAEALKGLVTSLGMSEDEVVTRIRGMRSGRAALVVMGLLSNHLPRDKRLILLKERLVSMEKGGLKNSPQLQPYFDAFADLSTPGDENLFLEFLGRNPELDVSYRVFYSTQEDNITSAVADKLQNDLEFRLKFARLTLDLLETVDRKPTVSKTEQTAYAENAYKALFGTIRPVEPTDIHKGLFDRFKPELAKVLQKAAKVYLVKDGYKDPRYWINYGYRRFLEYVARSNQGFFKAWNEEDWAREQLGPLKGKKVDNKDLQPWIDALFGNGG